jgi:hypothetical protein
MDITEIFVAHPSEKMPHIARTFADKYITGNVLYSTISRLYDLYDIPPVCCQMNFSNLKFAVNFAKIFFYGLKKPHS